MTEPTAEPTVLPTEEAPPLRWKINLFNPADGTDGHMSPTEEHAQALANLRDKIRGEGFVIVAASVRAGESTPIMLDNTPDGWSRWDGNGKPDGSLTEWSAAATERDTDPPDLLPIDTDQQGIRWFKVDEPIRSEGGEVRLRHDVGGEVTVYAYRADNDDGEKMGYLIAADVDENVVAVTLLQGTGIVSVQPDEETPTPER